MQCGCNVVLRRIVNGDSLLLAQRGVRCSFDLLLLTFAGLASCEFTVRESLVTLSDKLTRELLRV